MKNLLIVLLAGVCLMQALAAERPTRPHMKGMEMYSWSDDGRWVFVLLPGTNRLKTEKEIKEHPHRIETVAGLTTAFLQLARGEQVVWNFKFVPGFEYPDEKIVSDVVAAAKQAGITLIHSSGGD